MKHLFLFQLVVVLLGVSSMAFAKDPSVVPSVDLSRYAGKWYEIARFPNRFQDQCAGNVTAQYSLQPDGKIRVVNECRLKDGTTDRAEGVARLADPKAGNSKLKVRFAPAFLSFLPFVWGDYWIIDLAEDYSYALVGDPDRKYLWILARNQTIDESTFRRLVDKARQEGFPVDKLQRTRQE